MIPTHTHTLTCFLRSSQTSGKAREQKKFPPQDLLLRLAPKLTIHWNDSQDKPRSPFRKVLNEHQGHESTYHDEICLLQPKRTLPMDTNHSHNTKVPDHECHRNVVHGNIICLKNFTKKKENSRLHLLEIMETNYRCKLQNILKKIHIQCSGINVKFFLQLVLNYSSQWD